ncbi:PREDICTED: lysine-rich arabinogalactan protein 19-like [Vollenhovia emeryi]|uniref:lysine-rich arabinogalactan protein 19-like n=1 Tax=Vollenhovia emeryi TaxID=411798 RepID=UPI0005F4DE57|nr:PREDICTED: lysine-rich arabinogalactan protein 19-like [Vollenhovia emeryi]
MTTEHDVLAEIDALLRDTEPYDPAAPAIGDQWVRLYRADPEAEPPPARPTTQRAVPRVGTVIQRSDATNERKRAWLLSVPPPLPPRPAPTPAAPRPTLQPARPEGPLPPPPIPVEVETGVTVDVPHFAAHVSRRYKARLGNRRWVIRFNGNGKPRSVREIVPQ